MLTAMFGHQFAIRAGLGDIQNFNLFRSEQIHPEFELRRIKLSLVNGH